MSMIHVDLAAARFVRRFDVGDHIVLPKSRSGVMALRNVQLSENHLSQVSGKATALMGERAAMACTVAVEEVIDEHYRAQAERLGNTDPALSETIEAFRADELRHLHGFSE